MLFWPNLSRILSTAAMAFWLARSAGVEETELAFGELKAGDAHADESDLGAGFPALWKSARIRR